MDNFYKAPAVIASRLPMIWMNAVAPTALGQREMDRMFSEKVLATWQGGLMAQSAAMTGAFAFWTSIISGRFPAEATRAYLDGICTAALAPTRSAIGANARRLARRKRR